MSKVRTRIEISFVVEHEGPSMFRLPPDLNEAIEAALVSYCGKDLHCYIEPGARWDARLTKAPKVKP